VRDWRLGLDGETKMEIEVDAEHDSIVLKPAVILTREDA
jgi:hypothetical protein